MSKIPFASGPFKVCSTCGRELNLSDWEALPLLGHQVIPPWKEDPGEVLEMKNDVCGSTLAITMPFTAKDFEVEVVQLQRADPGLPLKHARSLAVVRLKDLLR